jgi:hypothetical protein
LIDRILIYLNLFHFILFFVYYRWLVCLSNECFSIDWQNLILSYFVLFYFIQCITSFISLSLKGMFLNRPTESYFILSYFIFFIRSITSFISLSLKGTFLNWSTILFYFILSYFIQCITSLISLSLKGMFLNWSTESYFISFYFILFYV